MALPFWDCSFLRENCMEEKGITPGLLTLELQVSRISISCYFMAMPALFPNRAHSSDLTLHTVVLTNAHSGPSAMAAFPPEMFFFP